MTPPQAGGGGLAVGAGAPWEGRPPATSVYTEMQETGVPSSCGCSRVPGPTRCPKAQGELSVLVPHVSKPHKAHGILTTHR